MFCDEIVGVIFLFDRRASLRIEHYTLFLTCVRRVANLLGAASTRKFVKETSFVPDGTRFGYYVRGTVVMKYRRNVRRWKNFCEKEKNEITGERGGVHLRWKGGTWTESYFFDKLFWGNLPDKCRLGAGLSNRRSVWNHGETGNHRCARC